MPVIDKSQLPTSTIHNFDDRFLTSREAPKYNAPELEVSASMPGSRNLTPESKMPLHPKSQSHAVTKCHQPPFELHSYEYYALGDLKACMCAVTACTHPMQWCQTCHHPNGCTLLSKMRLRACDSLPAPPSRGSSGASPVQSPPRENAPPMRQCANAESTEQSSPPRLRRLPGVLKVSTCRIMKRNGVICCDRTHRDQQAFWKHFAHDRTRPIAHDLTRSHTIDPHLIASISQRRCGSQCLQWRA